MWVNVCALGLCSTSTIKKVCVCFRCFFPMPLITVQKQVQTSTICQQRQLCVWNPGSHSRPHFSPPKRFSCAFPTDNISRVLVTWEWQPVWLDLIWFKPHQTDSLSLHDSIVSVYFNLNSTLIISSLCSLRLHQHELFCKMEMTTLPYPYHLCWAPTHATKHHTLQIH